MKAPSFWHTPRHPLSIALTPLSMLYSIIGKLRFALATPYRAPVPVICIGNIVAGGAGKTPTVIALAKLLQEHGKTPHIISRGYGGNLTATTRVLPQHTAEQTGDEPLLLAKAAPCWIGKDRAASIQSAVKEGADCILMDDGLQNPSINKDVSIIVIDGGYGIGNGAVIPAGPCRETLTSAAKRADAVLCIGEDTTDIITQFPVSLKRFYATIKPQISDTLYLRPVLAFCGIGRPQKFYDTLFAYNLTIAASQNFADHHFYTDNELELLISKASSLNATLVTTEKDWLRLSDSWKARIAYVPIILNIKNKNKFIKILLNIN